MKIRWIHLLVALTVLTASSIVHGRWTNRWAAGASQEGKNLLDGIEGDIGDWQAADFIKMNPAELPPNTRCDTRRFQPRKNGKPIMVSVTSGSPGAVAVHTPDVCFLGAGWKLRGEVTRQTIPLADGQSAAFWMADFNKSSATGIETIRVRWTWTADGRWQAPSLPRWVFGGVDRAPILYKLYMVQPLSEEDDLTRDDPYRKFAADLMPALGRQLQQGQ